MVADGYRHATDASSASVDAAAAGSYLSLVFPLYLAPSTCTDAEMMVLLLPACLLDCRLLVAAVAHSTPQASQQCQQQQWQQRRLWRRHGWAMCVLDFLLLRSTT